MINALNQTDANLHMRRAEMARLLRRGVVVVALTCLSLEAAYAQRNAQRDDTQQVPHSERFQLPRDADNRTDARSYDPRAYDPRAYDARAYEAREEQRRQAQMQQEQMRNSENMRRSGRMTPDERRDLRRQINEAGMDLYQNPPRR